MRALRPFFVPPHLASPSKLAPLMSPKHPPAQIVCDGSNRIISVWVQVCETQKGSSYVMNDVRNTESNTAYLSRSIKKRHRNSQPRRCCLATIVAVCALWAVAIISLKNIQAIEPWNKCRRPDAWLRTTGTLLVGQGGVTWRLILSSTYFVLHVSLDTSPR
jgi:hypothetical protein